MHLRDIALNNLRRRKSKMIFLVFGMVFGIATIVTLFSITSAMQKDFNKKFNELGAKLIIAPDTKKLALVYGGITVAESGISYDVKDLSVSAVDEIKAIPGSKDITGIAPKLLGAVEIKGSKTVIVGVDFTREFQMKGYWEVRGNKPTQSNEILLGGKAAKKFKVEAGQELALNGQTFKVAGVLLDTGSEEDGLIFMDLPQAQVILQKEGSLSFIEVTAARNGTPVKELQAQIQGVIPEAKVNTVTAAMESRKELVDRFVSFSLGVSLVVLVIGSLIVMTSMLASVSERTREIGIFRAIGFRKSHIMKMIYLEAAFVSIVSGIIGFVAGVGTAVAAAPLVMEQMQVSISWNPLLGLGAVILALFMGLLASTYPALQAAKLDPAESLRFI